MKNEKLTLIFPERTLVLTNSIRSEETPGIEISESEILKLPKNPPFHYPGDNETFGHGIRLTDHLGLKELGIWYETLMPGRRSSWPHAHGHTHEIEYAYIIRGQLTLWENGFTRELKPGDDVQFSPNTGVAHCLINNSNDPAIYVARGLSGEIPGEKIIYPLHPLRQRECDRKGFGWQDRPPMKLGPHPGHPDAKFPDHVQLRLCSPEDAPAVLEVFKNSPDYFENVEGCLPTLEMARDEILTQPKKINGDYYKEFHLILRNGISVGIVDLHINHPEPGIIYIGLLIAPGFGRAAYNIVEDYCRRALGGKRIRLAVSEANNVIGYWSKMGFQKNIPTH